MNSGFVWWLLIIGALTLILGAPLWGCVGLALIGGLVGNIDRRMIVEKNKRIGLD